MTRRLAPSATILTLGLLLVSCAASSYECNDPLGCLEIPPDSPVVIGAILATNGEWGSMGTASLQSVQNAIAERIELLGHPIQLFRYATDCTAESARSAATEYSTYSNLAAVIGPSCPKETIIAHPILVDAGIPLLSPVPDALTASELTNRVLDAIAQVSVQLPDKTLYIPRQALFDELGLLP